MPTIISGTTGIDLVQANATKCTTTNDNAAAGYVGEYVESVVASGSSLNLTNNVALNITSISLTAGDWDVSGRVGFISTNASTLVTLLAGSVNTSSATLGSNLVQTNHTTVGPGLNAVSDVISTGITRFSLAVTTTVYLVGLSQFSASTAGGFGRISARRIR